MRRLRLQFLVFVYHYLWMVEQSLSQARHHLPTNMHLDQPHLQLPVSLKRECELCNEATALCHLATAHLCLPLAFHPSHVYQQDDHETLELGNSAVMVKYGTSLRLRLRTSLMAQQWLQSVSSDLLAAQPSSQTPTNAMLQLSSMNRLSIARSKSWVELFQALLDSRPPSLRQSQTKTQLAPARMV